MDSRALVTRIAFLIIGFSLLNVILWGVFIGSRGILSNVVGLVLNVVLALFLISGQNWARWVMAIRSGLGAILSFSAWSQLGDVDFSFFSIIRLWLLLVALFSAAIGVYLVFSKRVNDYFKRSSGF